MRQHRSGDHEPAGRRIEGTAIGVIGRAQRRSERHVLSQLETGLAPVARPNPMVLAWRWRHALAPTIGVAALVHYRVSMWILLLGGHAMMILGLTPSVRRFVIQGAWCVITPHRVRRACAEARIFTRHGKIPIILWTFRDPRGERIVLYCRAGTSPKDFRDTQNILRTACWAKKVTVTRHPRYSSLAILNIIRS
jgi:hypothetical protein